MPLIPAEAVNLCDPKTGPVYKLSSRVGNAANRDQPNTTKQSKRGREGGRKKGNKEGSWEGGKEIGGKKHKPTVTLLQ